MLLSYNIAQASQSQQIYDYLTDKKKNEETFKLDGNYKTKVKLGNGIEIFAYNAVLRCIDKVHEEFMIYVSDKNLDDRIEFANSSTRISNDWSDVCYQKFYEDALDKIVEALKIPSD